MRLFIAIELPDAVREHLTRVQEALKPRLDRVSFTRPANLHVTLKFLGEVEPKRLDPLTESLGKVRAGGPVDLVADHGECFPPRGPVRIVAAGMGGSVDTLRAVHDAIEQRCKFIGFDREGRAYRPHVTLARARLPLKPSERDVIAVATEMLWPGPRFDVEHFSLVESRLRPGGSEYTTVARFPLA